MGAMRLKNTDIINGGASIILAGSRKTRNTVAEA